MEQATVLGNQTDLAAGNATPQVASNGSAGLQSQAGNQPTTVSGASAVAPNGSTPTDNALNAGGFIEPDIDEELFKFSGDDTPLMNLMLKAKKVTVNSPEVDHYSIDEPSAIVTVDGNVSAGNKIKLVAADKMKVHAYDVLSVVDVQGFTGDTSTGNVALSGRPLQLFVVAVDDDDEITVRATNGIKSAATDEYGDLPTAAAYPSNYITDGTKLIIEGNALYETQKEVDPDLVLPKPERIYLQKRGMNQIVSDYFESQRKRIPYSKAIIAEAAIRNFKVKGNRTLLISQPAKFKVKAKKTGDMQYVYTTTGVRWQVKRELEHTGKWTYEEFIALAKMFYTGEDVPNSCLALCGKNAMESIQCIDWSKHPEVKVEVKLNDRLGWKVTAITTVFGEIQFKREPTMDRCGYENCLLLLGEDRLVHYQRKAESQFNEKVEGEEATRSGMIVWDALGLKGSCHMWVDGKGGETAKGATEFKIWSSSSVPTINDVTDGVIYYFVNDITLNASVSAKAGEMYKAVIDEGSSSGSGDDELSWEKYYGVVSAQ